jgi:hypothetical protein
VSYIFHCIGVTDKTYVEFGTQSGAECVIRYDWSRLAGARVVRASGSPCRHLRPMPELWGQGLWV